MGLPLDPTVQTLHIVEAERDIPDARADTVVVVLDPAWTPMPEGRPDVLAVRRLFGAVVRERDMFDGALERIDVWADDSRAADRLVVDGVTYWFRMRETMWRWLHERLLWRHALASIGADERRLAYRIPATEEALRDVASRLGTVDAEEGAMAPSPVEPPAVAARVAPPWRAAIRRMRRVAGGLFRVPVGPATGGRPTSADTRMAELTDRVARLAPSGRPRVIVLTTPVTYQRVAAGGAPRDPILGSVIDALEAAGLQPVLMAIGLDPRRDVDWSIVAADERMLPGTMLASRWARPEDGARVDRALTTISEAVEGLRATDLDVDGVDLTDVFIDALRDRLLHVIRHDVLHQARVERLIAELSPGAIVLAQEGIRVPWLVAGRDAGVPVFAVQHGILYAGHPGYPHRRHPAVARPAKTFVYGTSEATTLLARGAYLESEVEVSGSPRLDLDSGGGAAGVTHPGPEAHAVASDAAERAAVRAELGVRDGDRVLVVSTVNLPFVQRAHFAPMVDRVLGGPLDRVHIVFKLHPGEREDGPYRRLLEGLARARGDEPPPISVVRDIDLYRLLRAADAHLGLHSTVLTDAVAAGTPNLLATVDAHVDILGYLEAGVARPVQHARDVAQALDAPAPPDPSARAAFLASHFRPGNAGERIAREVLAAIERKVTAPVAGQRDGGAR